MDCLLQVENLNKSFKSNKVDSCHAVKNVSFTMHYGEILGLVGFSGCGKSTLAALISGLLQPDSGKIYFAGTELTTAKRAVLQTGSLPMQMIFQNPKASFNPHKTIAYSVGEALLNAGLSKQERNEKVNNLLKLCNLSLDITYAYPHELSGGECQRAAIARALATESKLLICDEATASLDLLVEKEIMTLLKKIHVEKQLAILFICHDLALVQAFCERVMLMQNGQIVEIAGVKELIKEPQTAYAKSLLEAAFYSA